MRYSYINQLTVHEMPLPAFQKHSCSLKVATDHRQKQRGGIVARTLRPSAYLTVGICPRGHEHANDLSLPLNCGAETNHDAAGSARFGSYQTNSTVPVRPDERSPGELLLYP